MAVKCVALEPVRKVGAHDLYPIVWTLVKRDIKGRCLSLMMCCEALGVVVRQDSECRALMVDGRELTVDELALEHPSLAEALAALR